ncbi:aminomethyl-transferring glycine dehydrogenase subunit GcvPA [Halobellus salinisoli]|uniref:aminomethyl-transferring glycine dehydrogenase subunit GcvPA n=1 Tax=Halobellus salinisoli TaxID=3108500 RepID=UPI003009262F
MPYATHPPDERAAMLDEVGIDDPAELFDIPDAVRFTGEYGIDAHSERDARARVGSVLDESTELTEFLGGGHYDHYVPSVVDHLSLRSEFLTSYTQYQPEIAQGFLQALFEFQSLVVELTGMDVANASMYDRSTALGEAALLASRVRGADGDTVLVPDSLPERVRSVLENYTNGPGIAVERYPTTDGTADVDALESLVGDDTLLVYAATPNDYGLLEPELDAIGALAHDADALFCVGSDAVALSVLEPPATAGADIVVGDASVLGMGTTYGMGLGIFAAREEYLRQLPGRLVGASEDDSGNRAYTLTLQTREQHIRRERATSNICSNQAWVALRASIHAAWLGPRGLIDLAEECVAGVDELCARLDGVEGVTAPVYEGAHFREVAVETDAPAAVVAGRLREEGFALRTRSDGGDGAEGEDGSEDDDESDDEYLVVCVTDTNRDAVDDLADALASVSEVSE